MNPYINIALLLWTLLNAIMFFLNGAMQMGREEIPEGAISVVISFLSLFTALLAIGQYIK